MAERESVSGVSQSAAQTAVGRDRITLAFPLSTRADLLEELDRVDRQLAQPGYGTVVDHHQQAAHRQRLQRTRRQVLDQLAHIEEVA